MAKSVKKKSNRKLKRSVRRTLGALCMMTAIIVAAIPFPDAAADSADGIAAQANSTYTYDVTQEKDNLTIVDPTGLFDLKKVYKNDTSLADKIHMAHIVENANGAWYLDWQYKYYTPGDGQPCIITEYNSLYPKNTITLNSEVYSNYINIPQEEYQKIFTDTDDPVSVQLYAGDEKLGNPISIESLGKSYTLNGDPDDANVKNTEDYQFIYDYFPDEFKQYQTDYRAYKEAKATDPNANVYPPDQIKKTNADRYSEEGQAQYICDAIFGTNTKVDLTLQIVYKKVTNSDGTSGQAQEIRIPRLTEAPSDGSTVVEVGNGSAYRVDPNLFLAKNFASLIGVASGAFTDIDNVDTLIMSEQVYLIADSAFEHSFVQSITLASGARIGNRAFYNCPNLTSVTLPDKITQIGTAAFAKTLIKSITIPATVDSIGDGAFSECKSLQEIIFGGTSSSTNRKIGEAAFYGCPALNSVEFQDSGISSIGEGAFALNEVPSGSLTEVRLPNSISNADNIGDYLFSGRTNLSNVVMPKNLNANILKPNLFADCVSLGSVTFPDEAQEVSYPAALFNDVINENFYVRGPKSTYSGSTSLPRKSTWDAYFNGSTDNHVPYVYSENGKDYYEVSDGTYVLTIDDAGMLTSCEFVKTAGPIETFTIPSQVGTTTVTGIADGCLGTSDDTSAVLGYIKNLVVEDGSQITTVGDGVFSKAGSLETVTLGDSIQSIGKEAFSSCDSLTNVAIGSGITSIGEGAFKNCDSLTEIAFDNPAGGAESFPLSNIGENAFSTNGDELTIYGLINGSYGPFAWAMQPDNFMDSSSGIRVCYKSPKDDPQSMTVILDNSNNLPTLVDYPKYNDDEIQDIIKRVNSGEAITPSESAKLNAVSNVVIPDGVKSIDSKGYFASNSKIMGDKPTYTSNQSNIKTYFSNGIATENGDGLFNSSSTLSELTGEYEFGSADQYKYETEEAGNDRLESITLTSVEYLPEACFASCERLTTVDLGSAMKEIDSLPFLGCFDLTSIACGSGNFSCNNGILYENLDDGTKKIVECLPGRGDIVGSSTVSVDNDPDLVNVSEIEEAAFSECPNVRNVNLIGANNFKKIPERCFENSSNIRQIDLPENARSLGERAFATGGDYLEVIVRGREVSLGDDAFANVKDPYLVTYEDAGVREDARDQGVNVEKTLDEMLEVEFFMPDGTTLINTIFIEEGGNAKKLAPDADEMREQGYITAEQDLYGWSGSEDITNITEPCFFLAKIGLKNGIDTNGDGIPDTPNTNTGDGNDPTNPGGNGGTGNGNTNTGNGGGSGSGNNNNNNNKDNDGDSDSDSTKKYTLTVVYGDGSGVYASGSKVIISAIQPPAGKEFYKWETNNTGVTITSATSAATTVKTTDSDATVTATYRDKGTVSSNTVTRKPIGSSGTSVQISKPGISNTDKAYASVSGSTDNFIVKITETTEAANAVATALSNEYADMNPIKYFAMDISLYDKNGNKVTNTNGLSVNITMPIPDALVQYGGNNRVGAVVNGNVLEKLNCKFTTVSGIPCITFTATHFSPYTIYVDTSNLSVNNLDSTPKTGDGIHPKWFFSMGLACISILLFMKKDKATPRKAIVS